MNHRFTYDLVEQPWLPCIDLQGRSQKLGLRQILTKAHQLRELKGDSPPVTAALHRLLLAILHRIFGPAYYADWQDLWSAKAWEVEKIDTYFAQWSHRFDLFDAERPFYQMADPRVKPKSIINLVPEFSSGNDPTLFDQHTEDIGSEFTPDQAARQLIAAQAFGLAGLSGIKEKFTDGTCTRGVIFLVEGDNLFQTLALNLIRYPAEQPLYTSHNDKPAWEMDDPFQPDRNLPFGYLDYLTWQNRRILLFPEEREKMTVVRQVTRGPALVFDRSILDPHKLYRLDRKKAPKVLRFNEYRSLWRDSSSLLMLAKSSKPSSFAPPATFRWLHELVQESALDKSRVCRYRALGMANNQARVFFYRDERMPLPLHYLDDESLVFKLTEAADLAEQSGRKLQYAMRTLANLVIKPSCNQKGVPPPDPQYRKRLTQYWAAERTYWAELESPFRTLVVDLPRQSEEALANWYGLIGRAAWDAFEQSAVSAGDNARTLRAAVIARRQLGAGLKKIFSFLEEQTI